MENNFTICDGEKCTGCAACANICKHNAIEMHYDEEGFLRPQLRVRKTFL